VTIIVSLYGGPGSGKSTLAAEVFAELKKRNYSVELVREYVKAWAWRGDKIKKWDELYILSKQLREESNLYGNVDWIISDRPLNMSSVYDRFYSGSGLLIDTCKRIRELQIHEGLKHLDLFVKRIKPYNQAGRFESEDSARKVDEITKEMFPDMKEVSTLEDVISQMLTHQLQVDPDHEMIEKYNDVKQNHLKAFNSCFTKEPEWALEPDEVKI